MSFINDKQAQTVCNGKQTPIDKIVISQPLWGDQEQVELVSEQSAFNAGPICLIRRVDCFCSHPDIPIGRDLVSHERQERRNQKRAAPSLVAQESRRKKVDEALPPSGPLNDEKPLSSLSQRGNRLPLTAAEIRLFV